MDGLDDLSQRELRVLLAAVRERIDARGNARACETKQPTTEELDDELLDAYVSGFHGFGTYAGSVWLVGMEEGGGGTPDAVARRLATWDARGRPEIDDVAEFHAAADLGDYFTPTGQLIKTYRGVLRVLLGAQGRPVTRDSVTDYQRSELGRLDGNDCVLELMPLPSPRANTWHYGQWSALPYLRNRDQYMAHVAQKRVRHLRNRIAEHRPRLVVFYGASHRSWFEQVACAPLTPSGAGGAYFTRNSHTLFTLVRHPNARGATNLEFETAGAIAAQMIRAEA